MKKEKKKISGKLILYFVMRFLVVTLMIVSILQRNYNNVFMCILTLILFMIPTIIDRKLNIKLPTVLECIIILFIFAAEILGEINGFYLKFQHWDTMLHTLNGFIMAAIGFAMIDILNQSPRLHFNMSPIFVTIVAFCFSMTIGVLWEFFEYSMDICTLTDMQKDTMLPLISSVTITGDTTNTATVIKDITQTVIEGTVNGVKTQTVIDGGYLDIGLFDTMADLAVNCIGAVCFSIIGYFYILGRGHFAKSFIPQMKTEEEISQTKPAHKNKNSKK